MTVRDSFSHVDLDNRVYYAYIATSSLTEFISLKRLVQCQNVRGDQPREKHPWSSVLLNR